MENLTLRTNGDTMNDVRSAVCEVRKDADGTIWLHLRDTKKRQAMLNMQALAEKQTSMMQDIILQWSEDQFTLTQYPQ
jgi:hypothetical protein